ncbi:MAG TPA: S8 family serine peptidase [Streptosporangiaceae bacterium]|nr:S8 family serine peptidase [Streptosporangiaceae bacterium]
MSHRLLRGTLLPFATGLAAVLTVLGAMGLAPAIATASAPAAHGNNARGQEWWLAGLHVPQAWRETQGSGVTVAVLGTGVAASYPGLSGSVLTGPDYTGSGRAPGSSYWGVEGTAVAGIIASHQRQPGLVGVAPAVKILSVRVTLEFNDPLVSDQALSRRLPQAIANGIRWAADHGARVIDLPLDPGTLGLTSKGDPAAAGGSTAERAAVGYALSKGVVLVAPAGDDGQGPGLMNYPAAYPGVIAVGAIGRTGQLASFSSRRSYPALTAPGVSLLTATPPAGYGTISSTSTASGIVAGVAALVLSRFPHLTVAQVTQALTESTVAGVSGASLPPLPARSHTGAGYGTVDAIRAVDMADVITTASQPRQQPAPAASPTIPARHTAVAAVAAARHPAASTLAGSVLRDAVVVVGGLIVLLVIALLILRSRRERGRTGAADRTRIRGQHETRRPERGAVAATGFGPARNGRTGPAAPAGPPQAVRLDPAGAAGYASPAGWQGGGIGEISPGPARPAVAPAPRSTAGYRFGRGAGRADATSGPPWAPAPEPKRLIGPLPVASAALPPPEPGRGIRVPRDMAVPPGATTEPEPPVSFDLTTPPADFDLATPAFGLTPPAFGVTLPAFDPAPPSFDPAPPALDVRPSASGARPPAFDPAPPASGVASRGSGPTWPAFGTMRPGSAPGPSAASQDPSGPGSAQSPGEARPTTESLGFAAAPVPADVAAPPAGGAPGGTPERAAAADPSFIWDLAATDVFPAATDAAVLPDDAPEADEG